MVWFPPTWGRAFLFRLRVARKRELSVSDFAVARLEVAALMSARQCEGDFACRPDARMKLSELIVQDLVEVPLRAADKWQALSLIARVPQRAGRCAESMVATIEQALVARERSMSTGMEHGIAIPHAAVDGLDELIAVLALAPDGIPFEAVDKKPAQILVALIYPRHKKLTHIKTLAEIARMLARADVRQRLLECKDPGAVIATLRELDGVA